MVRDDPRFVYFLAQHHPASAFTAVSAIFVKMSRCIGSSQSKPVLIAESFDSRTLANMSIMLERACANVAGSETRSEAFLSNWLLGLGAAAAILLAASLAPTNPVLASDVQVGPPKSGEEDETRFALTSEAGLNDALAFPFVVCALALAEAGRTGDPWFMQWLSVEGLR